MLKALLVTLAIVTAPSALAQGTGARAELDISASFAEQRERIRAELADGETFAEITPQQLDEVQAALGRIQSALGTVSSVDELPASQRIDLFNDQEVVNTILTSAREDSRMVCRREKILGSNRREAQCFTVAQRREARAEFQLELKHGQREMLGPQE